MAELPPEGLGTLASLLHDWNEAEPRPAPRQSFELLDETLRDGLQSPSVVHPSLEAKLELLGHMSAVGIRAVNVGMPGAGGRLADDTIALCRHIRDHRLDLEPVASSRTLVKDIEPVLGAVQASGQRLTLYTFIGSSPIRQWAEAWDLDFILRTSEAAIGFAVRQGLEVAYVTEDTVRTPPETLEVLFRMAVRSGARRLVLCDTVGHATPTGAASLVRWTLHLMERLGVDVKVEWHGHNDRGLALATSLAALEAGAHRIHGCGLGLGERVGNTSIDLLLLNLKLLGWVHHDVSGLVSYVRKVSEACHVPIPFNYPLAGSDAFRTSSGVHAAALIKSFQKGEPALADRVYSAIPAAEFGQAQRIEIGPASGMSNVRFWLESHRLPLDEALCGRILEAAKHSDRILTDEELHGLALESGTPGRRGVSC
ncbi:MAG TPA: 2-isopropylmalate synthase [Myxococcaceae bacterium]|jgi:2-isopropylmalate synthase